MKGFKWGKEKVKSRRLGVNDMKGFIWGKGKVQSRR